MRTEEETLEEIEAEIAARQRPNYPYHGTNERTTGDLMMHRDALLREREAAGAEQTFLPGPTFSGDSTGGFWHDGRFFPVEIIPGELFDPDSVPASRDYVKELNAGSDTLD